MSAFPGTLLLLFSLALPAALALAVALPAMRPVALRLAPWGAAPALLLALAGPAGALVELPWMLVGTRLGLDGMGRPFLLLTGAVWLLAGLYGDAYLREKPRRHVFWAFFLATLAGNVGVCLALDAASFYFAFALMSFAAYGLVVHDGTEAARRAGRVYLVMVVLGEGLLVAAFLMSVAAAGTHYLPELVEALAFERRPGVAALFLAGFGIKAGVLLLHLWLPLAHPVAPVPASAVLSGAILKAGLLGWLRFLPLGGAAVPDLGTLVLAGGLAAAFYGVAVGLAQRDPKVVLAYSSISQMGMMTAGVGAGLLAPAAWPALLPAVGLLAVHHALAKSALFLGVGVLRARGGSAVVLAGMAVPALALAGAPWTAGAFAKDALKAALHPLPEPWPAVLAWLLPLAAFATALLMARLLVLGGRETAAGGGRGLAARWCLSLLAVVALAVWAAATAEGKSGLLGAALPPVAAAATAGFVVWRRWRAPSLPPGDVLVPLERGLSAARRGLTAIPVSFAPVTRKRHRPAWARLEGALGTWPVAGGLWLLLILALVGILIAAN